MSNNLMDLEVVTRDLCSKWLQACAAVGLQVKVTETFRSLDQQMKDYAQGRTTPGAIITKAKPGQSAHNYGMAFDFCFVGKTLKECYPSESDPRWLQAGQLGENLGLTWGGPNGKGDKFTFDRPHFERKDWKTAHA